MTERVLDRVVAMADQLRDQAAEAERIGRLTDDSVKVMKAAGLIRLLQPKSYQGFEVHPREFAETVMAVAALDPASGWINGVVGVHPYQLAYADPQAWKDVMGHHGSKRAEMGRWDKYYRSVPGIGTHIINADRADHSAMRKIFSHSFSEKAVRDQEPIIKEYINLFVQRLVENCDGGKATVEMSSYFNYLFFDVIGNLSYGEE